MSNEKNKEIELLKEQNKEMKNDLQNLTNILSSFMQKINDNQDKKQDLAVENKRVETEDYDYLDEDCFIPDNKRIRVKSLVNHTLLLSTESYGSGIVYEWNRFGQVQSITYANLSKILYNQRNFAERGLFYIEDEKVIKNHELDYVYKKILNDKQMANISKYNKEEMINLFSNTTKEQKEIISLLILEDLKKGKDIDLNKIDILSREYGKDIYAMYKNIAK